MKRIEAERKAMFDPNNPATKNAKNVFPNVPTPEVSNVDIQALAKRYEQRADARRTDDLMVFVSFTMPPESLKRIVAQVSRLGGTVVLNGFKDNSWKATAFAIKDLGEKRGNVVVNPNAFAKYKVKSVPVTVLTKPEAIDQLDSEGCALPDTYAAVAGDVSLDYALDEIAQHDRRFTELAQRYARQLRGR
jgi:conjugal transfer pilus assembly protein TrbC